tara:strand:- start:514 stop:705 length:192 start_codon:yes stop_codon:yes gene_type:complete
MKYPAKDYIVFIGSCLLMTATVAGLVVLIMMARHKIINIQCEDETTRHLAGIALCPPPVEVPR